jgi:hypothetical protein
VIVACKEDIDTTVEMEDIMRSVAKHIPATPRASIIWMCNSLLYSVNSRYLCMSTLNTSPSFNSLPSISLYPILSWAH